MQTQHNIGYIYKTYSKTLHMIAWHVEIFDQWNELIDENDFANEIAANEYLQERIH